MKLECRERNLQFHGAEWNTVKYYILAEEEQIYNFCTFCNNFTFILDRLERKKASYNTVLSL